MNTNKRDLTAELEAIVDEHEFLHVMTALEFMCDEKAAWVESPESIGRPDKALGRIWRKCARACRKAADVAVELP